MKDLIVSVKLNGRCIIDLDSRVKYKNTKVFFCFSQDSDEEDKDPELRKAIKKMKKLDQILALKVSAEREVKRKGRELHLRLWQELQVGFYIHTHQWWIENVLL